MISLTSKLLCWPLILVIRLYQAVISPFMPQCCRFYPSCSAYAIQCLNNFGLFRGLWLTFGRLMRCRPGYPGGYDPVPDISEIRRNK